MLRFKLNNCLPSKMIAVAEHCRMALQNTSLHQWYWGRWLLRSISTGLDCCWFTWWGSVDNVNLRSSCDNSKVAMSWKTLQPICVSLCWNLQSMGTFSTIFAYWKNVKIRTKPNSIVYLGLSTVIWPDSFFLSSISRPMSSSCLDVDLRCKKI